MNFFTSIYYIMLCIVHLCAIPFLFLLSFKQKYRYSLKKRFFVPDSLQEAIGFKLYWLHACSFGEVQSLQMVIESLTKRLGNDEKILLTTTTQTGFTLAKNLYPKCVVRYLPFETLIPFWLRNSTLV
ncbi:glycosyltransferase N-terminal domain-containing protein, partial [Helicobacter rodentium]